jgi:hypothetical protein
MKGDWAEAIPRSGQALALFRQTDGPTILAFAWDSLGIVHSRLGETRQARSARPGPP